MTPMTAEFEEIWLAAGRFLHGRVEGGLNTWLRVHRSPTFLEHLNQPQFPRQLRSTTRACVSALLLRI